MYKVAILGCGGRSRKHMEAYKHTKRGKVVAICDMDETSLNKYGDEFGIENRYTNFEEMLKKEKPQVLHVINRPSLRLSTMTLISDYKVPAAIIEKPVAVDTEDYLAIRDLEKKSQTKFVINHQVHFHPKVLEFQKNLAKGLIGDLRYIEASAKMNLSGQGTHILDLMTTFNGSVRPKSLIAQLIGAEEIDTKHPAPNMALASIEFKNGVRGQILCGSEAPAVEGSAGVGRNKRVALHGTRGMMEWQMNRWEIGSPQEYEISDKSYEVEDEQGQTALTEATFDWLDDDKNIHPTGLSQALDQFNMILAIFDSALNHKTIFFPYTPEKSFLKDLKEVLK